MSKKLNIDMIVSAMESQGVSQADLAKQLSVSRNAVNKWFQGQALPRPNKLLQLAMNLGLSFDQVITRVNGDEPIIAYRKKGPRKTTEAHVERAREMGRLLRPLVKYLPFDELVRPATLKNPRPEYEYVQKAAAKTRKNLGLRPEQQLDFQDLIHKFLELQAVLVPVLWGSRQNHGNALHVHLPDSMTTWVYLNLDAYIHDFKFWMAHELGHILSPDLRDEEAEDFADAFAGALLFPREQAEAAWNEVRRLRKPESQLKKVVSIAEEELISPVTVYYAINGYLRSIEETPLKLEPDIFKAMNAVRSSYKTVSEILFEGATPEPEEYLNSAESLFESPIFDAVRAYMREEGKGVGYIQSILDIPVLDARALAHAMR